MIRREVALVVRDSSPQFIPIRRDPVALVRKYRSSRSAILVSHRGTAPLGELVQEISARGENGFGWCQWRACKPVQILLFHEKPAALHAGMGAIAQRNFATQKTTTKKGGQQ